MAKVVNKVFQQHCYDEKMCHFRNNECIVYWQTFLACGQHYSGDLMSHLQPPNFLKSERRQIYQSGQIKNLCSLKCFLCIDITHRESTHRVKKKLLEADCEVATCYIKRILCCVVRWCFLWSCLLILIVEMRSTASGLGEDDGGLGEQADTSH